MAARTSGAAADGVSSHAERVVRLQRLDGRVHRVRHVRVDGGEPGPAGTAARTARERLVVGELPVADDAADRDVAHRARARRRDAVRCGGGQRAQDDVDDPL